MRACSARVISDHVALHAWVGTLQALQDFPHCLVRSVVGVLPPIFYFSALHILSFERAGD